MLYIAVRAGGANRGRLALGNFPLEIAGAQPRKPDGQHQDRDNEVHYAGMARAQDAPPHLPVESRVADEAPNAKK